MVLLVKQGCCLADRIDALPKSRAEANSEPLKDVSGDGGVISSTSHFRAHQAVARQFGLLGNARAMPGEGSVSSPWQIDRKRENLHPFPPLPSGPEVLECGALYLRESVGACVDPRLS